MPNSENPQIIAKECLKKTPGKTVTLGADEIGGLMKSYARMYDLVETYAALMEAALDLGRRNPEMVKRMVDVGEKNRTGIQRSLGRFKRSLEKALRVKSRKA